MRKIKFRGKWIDFQNRWVYGSLILVNNQPYINHATCVVKIEDSSIVTSASEVDVNTVGQFTGLYDRNGKGIYEGDIIRCRRKELFKVIWSSARFLLECIDYPGTTDIMAFLPQEIEVTGNIHDNPELMQGGTK